MTNTNSSNSTCSTRPGAFTARSMDELFDHLFNPTAGNGHARTWTAPTSIWEEQDEFHIEVELPGVSNDAVEVTYEEGKLQISAQRALPEERNYLHQERVSGPMRRTFSVPDVVDPDSIEAELSAGVLHLQFKKRPEVLPRKIEIKAS